MIQALFEGEGDTLKALPEGDKGGEVEMMVNRFID